ncbi:MAG TPA: hypothetical protein PK245_05805 [Clostridia bacterium]|nr:hypothetical protein [Clostridia bacterium]
MKSSLSRGGALVSLAVEAVARFTRGEIALRAVNFAAVPQVDPLFARVESCLRHGGSLVSLAVVILEFGLALFCGYFCYFFQFDEIIACLSHHFECFKRHSVQVAFLLLSI